MGMKEKLYKERVYENELLNYTIRSTKLNLITEFSGLFSPLLLSQLFSQQGDGYGFYRRKPWQEMTLLPSSAARDNPKHETSVFCSGNQREDCFLASDWAFWRALQKQFLGNFDRSTFISIDRLRENIRSIEF